ncbi:pseudouridine synthase [Desulfuromonas sp. AOP6]|uniref:pseudouridine synthase n=1 Tax=Desulfuromonas sp. AOP6 TaxID=1566351 RepID=UPI001279189D|nr:pseudouridine synthase [Desulfuromonas sp. AOP6]BCA80052.1 pseudouridine synthase [Desulfuromonas sp. AOP6]
MNKGAAERLQKIIAAAGLASRRQAEKWIEAGRVTVNGRLATLGDTADMARDEVAVDGKPLAIQGRRTYILLNKPAGYLTSLRDPQGRPLVTDLVREVDARLYPVGRLDFMTEGLLILTNDGDFAQRLAHPRHEVDKTYLVRVRGALTAAAQKRLQEGVNLEDGPTAPARVERVRQSGSHTWFEITIHEGRNRQVRRMCEAVGHPVSRLKRVRLAFLDLKDIPPGKFRHLTPAEVSRLKRL